MAGNGIALLALAYLVSPGLTALPLLGAILMLIAGVSWGTYSLLGRGSLAPIADTADNFILCAPIGVLLIVADSLYLRPSAVGLACAIASGSIASGMGYII